MWDLAVVPRHVSEKLLRRACAKAAAVDGPIRLLRKSTCREQPQFALMTRKDIRDFNKKPFKLVVVIEAAELKGKPLAVNDLKLWQMREQRFLCEPSPSYSTPVTACIFQKCPSHCFPSAASSLTWA